MLDNVNWDVIGAVATVLGVIGGFVSVYFLIYEVRRNALAIEGSTVQSLMAFEQSVYALRAEYAAVYAKGLKDRDDLTPEAQIKFDMVVQSYMSLQYSAFKQYQQNLIDAEVWQAYENGLRDDLSQPGFAASWGTFRASYPVSFQAVVTALESRPGKVEQA